MAIEKRKTLEISQNASKLLLLVLIFYVSSTQQERICFRCNKNSFQTYNNYCTENCLCDTNAGLACNSNICSCSADEIWDNECITVSAASDCDALILLPGGSLLAPSPFSSQSGWKCNTTTGRLYSPSYDPETGANKFIIFNELVQANDATYKCYQENAYRIRPYNDSDQFLFLAAPYTIKRNSDFPTDPVKTNSIWLGGFSNNSGAYWDDGTPLDSPYYSTETPGANGNCLYGEHDNNQFFIKELPCEQTTSVAKVICTYSTVPLYPTETPQ